jgi:hypothetical protein
LRLKIGRKKERLYKNLSQALWQLLYILKPTIRYKKFVVFILGAEMLTLGFLPERKLELMGMISPDV